MPRELKPCGTRAAYERHLRAARKTGERVTCRPCLDVMLAARQARLAVMTPEEKRAIVRYNTARVSEQRRVRREAREG